MGGQTASACSGGTWSRSVALWAALLGSSACNLASGLSDFEVVGGSHSSASGGASGGGSGGTAGAGGMGGSGTSSGTAGTGGSGPFSIDVPVIQAAGDAEECVSDGTMVLESPTLELGQEQGGWGPQIVGLRFEHLPVPRYATILSARVDFVAHEMSSTPTTVEIRGQASDQAFPFMLTPSSLSVRDRTLAGVTWENIQPWDHPGGIHSSPDLSSIIQEIVDLPGWESDRPLVLLIAGAGRRSAVAYDGSQDDAPSLHLEVLPP